jgi:hypothetical protein
MIVEFALGPGDHHVAIRRLATITDQAARFWRTQAR